MSNTIYGVATVEVILPSQTVTTSAVTTTAFDVSDYASGQVEVVVVVESNGGAGSIDYKVQYSPTDAISSGALVDPQDLETAYYKGGSTVQDGYKFDAFSLVGKSALKNINNSILFSKPTFDTKKVPNGKFQVVLTPTGLTGTNKVSVVLLKHNRP